MKVVQINAYCGSGSTGKICQSISQVLNKNGISNRIYYTEGRSDYENAINYGMGVAYTKKQSLMSRIKGNNGFNSKVLTKRLIQELIEYKPDIIHLHNLHAQNMNLEMLARYISENKIKTIWTFHDSWMLTGYCMNFDMIGCSKWKSGCENCPCKKNYAWIIDKSREIWLKKRTVISKIKPYVVVPSKWMGNIVEDSKIKISGLKVINNGINLNVFRNECERENEKKEKFLVLGVADRWDQKKGVDVFIELCDLLSDDYEIMLVGTNSKVEKLLPSRIITVRRTENQKQLAELYSKADVLVNTTREEIFGLVNVEALACGTPVITFDTGGSPECIDDKTGLVVKKDDLIELKQAIEKVCKTKPFNSSDCENRAKKFNEEDLYLEYLNLYKEVYNKDKV